MCMPPCRPTKPHTHWSESFGSESIGSKLIGPMSTGSNVIGSNFIGTRALLTGSSHHLDPCTLLGAPLAAHTRRRRCGLRADMPLFGGRPYWQPEKSHPSAVVASSPRTHGSKCRGAAPFEQSSNGPPVGENPQKHPRRKICRCTAR